MASNQPAIDLGALSEALEKLQWGDGLTRDEMMNQSPALRGPELRQLPPGFRFSSASSVVSYFRHLEDSEPIDVSTYPPPDGYGDRSTTGQTFTGRATDPGVGSGYRNGNTGSSAQTGVGREGLGEHRDWDI